MTLERLALPFTCLIALLTITYMLFYSVNIPSVEDFQLYLLISDFYAGHFVLSDWVDFQANHRILLNRIIYLINFYLGNQIITLNFVSWIFVLGNLYLIVALLDEKRQNRTFLLASLFIFNWIQFETFVHAHTMNFNQEVFFALLTFYALKHKRILLMNFAMMMSFFTMLSWMAIIPIYFLELYRSKDKKLLWSLPLLLLGILFYQGSSTADPYHAQIYLSPAQLIPFGFALLGNLTSLEYSWFQMSLGASIFLFTLIAFVQSQNRWVRYLLLWGGSIF